MELCSIKLLQFFDFMKFLACCQLLENVWSQINWFWIKNMSKCTLERIPTWSSLWMTATLLKSSILKYWKMIACIYYIWRTLIRIIYCEVFCCPRPSVSCTIFWFSCLVMLCLFLSKLFSISSTITFICYVWIPKSTKVINFVFFTSHSWYVLLFPTLPLQAWNAFVTNHILP